MLTVCIIPTDRVTSTDRQKTAEQAENRFLRWLEKNLKVPEHTMRIMKRAPGIPYIEGYPMLHIGRSYCRECTVYALCTGRVGVDVEEIREYNKYLADQFYCEEELQDRSPESWTKTWTMKEAFVKYQETGLGGIRRVKIPVMELIEKNKLKVTDIRVNKYCICTVVTDTEHEVRRMIL